MTECDNVQLQAARSAEDACAAVKGRASCKNIIDENVVLIGVYGGLADKCKGIFQVCLTGFSIKNRLRKCVYLALQ